MATTCDPRLARKLLSAARIAEITFELVKEDVSSGKLLRDTMTYCSKTSWPVFKMLTGVDFETMKSNDFMDDRVLLFDTNVTLFHNFTSFDAVYVCLTENGKNNKTPDDGHKLVIIHSFNTVRIMHAWHNVFTMEEFETDERFAEQRREMSVDEFNNIWLMAVHELKKPMDNRNQTLLKRLFGREIDFNCSGSWFIVKSIVLPIGQIGL